MKGITLQIQAEEDTELRAYIKGLIASQVVSIMRETLGDIVKQEMGRLIEKRIDGYVEKAVNQVIGTGDAKTNYIRGKVSDLIRSEVQAEVIPIIQHFDTEQLIKEEINARTQRRVEAVLSALIGSASNR